MNWFGGIIVVFIVAAFLNPEWAPIMWGITGVLLLIFAVSSGHKLIVAAKDAVEKTRKDKAHAATLAAEQAEREAVKAELYPRLEQAFIPILELQQTLNQNLKSWLRSEYESNPDKIEYQAHLKKHLDEFKAIPPSSCNSEFLDVVKAPGLSVSVLILGNYSIAPCEVLDKSDWEKSMMFSLSRYFHEGKGEFSRSSMGLFDLDSAIQFIRLQLAVSLRVHHLEKAAKELQLPEGDVDEFAEAVRSNDSEKLQVSGSDDASLYYPYSHQHYTNRSENYP